MRIIIKKKFKLKKKYKQKKNQRMTRELNSIGRTIALYKQPHLST
jgi:hypothetical protein